LLRRSEVPDTFVVQDEPRGVRGNRKVHILQGGSVLRHDNPETIESGEVVAAGESFTTDKHTWLRAVDYYRPGHILVEDA
jgi:hypothetical protein